MSTRILRRVFLLSLTLTLPASAQQARPRPNQGPPISELHIAVQDLETQEQRGYVLPGQRLTLEVGDRVRLRMVGIPADSRRAPRYPSTRFSLVGRSPGLAISRVNEERGSAILEARETGGGRPAALRYELLEALNLPANMRQGQISVLVARVTPPPRRRGVTLYEHQDFRGRSETFYSDDSRLNDNHIQHDAASSVRLDPGCEVTLYEHPSYSGKSTTLTGDITDLNGSRVGNDSVSSLKLHCNDDGGDGRPRPGVTLYEHQDFRGRSETFYADDPRLNDNHIQHDTASSVRVTPGCRVTLYEHSNYGGKATALSDDLEDLNGSRVGNDSVSSLEVRCEGR